MLNFLKKNILVIVFRVNNCYNNDNNNLVKFGFVVYVFFLSFIIV